MSTVELVKRALEHRRLKDIELIRRSWAEHCAGDSDSDNCDACRAYADAIRTLGGEP